MPPVPTPPHPDARQRNQLLDVARGIGILLVVVGHSQFAGETKPWLMTFRMPLFFFMSGVFLSAGKSILPVVRVRAQTLLRPYLLMLLALWAAAALLGLEPLLGSRLGELAGILYGTGATIRDLPLWFLPHLFLVLVAAQLLVRRVRAPLALAALAAALLAGGVLTIGDWWGLRPGVLHASLGDLPGLPWSLDLAPVTLAFVLAGFLMRGPVRAARFRPDWLVAAALAYGLLHLASDSSMDLNLRQYDSLPVSTLKAFSGIALALAVGAGIVAHLPRLSGLLARLGNRSLAVLLFHGLILSHLAEPLARLLPAPPLAGLATTAAAIALPVAMAEIAARNDWWPAAIEALEPLARPRRRFLWPFGGKG